MEFMARRPFFMSKLTNSFSLNIGSEINLKDFSFSQLIIAVKKMFDTEGIPGFIKVLITLIESLVIKSGVECPYCSGVKCYKHATSQRKIKTSIGEVNLTLSRLICLGCNKTFSPMQKLFDLDKYARKSREFEKISLETITQQSFRRASVNLKDTLGFATAHTTLHRWFQNTDATHINVKKKVDYLIADGTGYKKHKDDTGSNRGEVRVIIGYNKDGTVIPFGAWTKAKWKDIGQYLKSANRATEKALFKPIAKTLITDGEEELIRYLKKLAVNHQRCLFHMTHEIVPLLRYQEGVKKDEAIKLSEELSDLLYIDLPQEETEPLKSIEDKLVLDVKLQEMKKSIEEFINELKQRGYKKAYTFVDNAKNQLFTYVENWLQTGITNPKVTSLVERTMREIKRRIKKIGFAWSESGAEKMTRLVLLQMSTTKQHWDNFWLVKTGADADIKLTFLGVDVKN